MGSRRLVWQAKAIGEAQTRLPAQDLTRPAVAESERLEAGLEPTGDEEAWKSALAREEPPAQPTRQTDARHRQGIGDRHPNPSGTRAPEVLTQVAPGTDLVTVHHVDHRAD